MAIIVSESLGITTQSVPDITSGTLRLYYSVELTPEQLLSLKSDLSDAIVTQIERIVEVKWDNIPLSNIIEVAGQYGKLDGWQVLQDSANWAPIVIAMAVIGGLLWVWR